MRFKGQGTLVVWLALSSAAYAQSAPTRPAFPLKASPDGRYLVDQISRPFFYQADTAGQRHIWRMDAEWRAALDSPGSKHMGHLQEIFTSIPCYQLVPDQARRLVVSGFGVFGDLDYVTAAHAQDGSVAIVYFPKLRRVTIGLRRLLAGVAARWIDPTSGQSTAVEATQLVRASARSV